MKVNRYTKSLFFLLLAALFTLPAFQEADTKETGKGKKAVKIALCQIFCLDGDRAGNLVRMEHALQEAASGGAKQVISPLCVLTITRPPAATTQRAAPSTAPLHSFSPLDNPRATTSSACPRSIV